MRSFCLQLILLVLTGGYSFLLHAQYNTSFILPFRNTSDSSSQHQSISGGFGSEPKPPALYIGTGNGPDGPDGPDRRPRGWSPVPIVVLGNCFSTPADPGKKPPPPDGDSKAPSDKDESSDQQPEQSQQGSSGAGNTPPENTDMDNILASAMTMLEELDELFQQSNENITLFLDLDNTILHRDLNERVREQPLRKKFTEFVNKWRNNNGKCRLKLIIVTTGWLGDKNKAKSYLYKNQLPEPDALIAMPPPSVVNASLLVSFFNNNTPVDFCSTTPIHTGQLHQINESSDSARNMIETLDINSLSTSEEETPESYCSEESNKQYDRPPKATALPIHKDIHFTESSLIIKRRFRNIIDFPDNFMKAFIENNYGDKITKQTEKIQDDITFVFSLSQSNDNFSSETWQKSIKNLVYSIYSIVARVDFDDESKTILVTVPMSKGGFISNLASLFQLDGTTVIAAGDDEPDLSMMRPKDDYNFSVYLAIMVSNATPDLVKESKDINDEHFYRAETPCLSGVIEGFLKAMIKLTSPQVPGHMK